MTETITKEFELISDELAGLIGLHAIGERRREDVVSQGILSNAARDADDGLLETVEVARARAETIVIEAIRAHGYDPWRFLWRLTPIDGSHFEVTLRQGQWPAPPWPATHQVRLTAFEAACAVFNREAFFLGDELDAVYLLARRDGISASTADHMLGVVLDHILGHRLPIEDRDVLKRALRTLRWRVPEARPTIERWNARMRASPGVLGDPRVTAETGQEFPYDMLEAMTFFMGGERDQRERREEYPQSLFDCPDAGTAFTALIEALHMSTSNPGAMCYPWAEIPKDGAVDPCYLLRGSALAVAKGFVETVARRLADDAVLNPSAYQIAHSHDHVQIEDPTTWFITLTIQSSVAAALSGVQAAREQ